MLDVQICVYMLDIQFSSYMWKQGRKKKVFNLLQPPGKALD